MAKKRGLGKADRTAGQARTGGPIPGMPRLAQRHHPPDGGVLPAWDAEYQAQMDAWKARLEAKTA